MPNFDDIKIYTNQLGKVLASRHGDLSFNDNVAVRVRTVQVDEKLEFHDWQAHIKQSISTTKSGTTISRVYE